MDDDCVRRPSPDPLPPGLGAVLKAPGPEDIQVGATLDQRTKMWVGWLHDGRRLMTLPHRGTRERAMIDAQNHKQRLLHPPVPKKIWVRT